MARNHVPAVRRGSPSGTRATNLAGSGGPPFPSEAGQRRLGVPGAAGGRARADPVPAISTWSWTPGSVALVCPKRGARFCRTSAAPPQPARVPQVTIRHLADGGAAGLAALEVVLTVLIRDASLRAVHITLQLGTHTRLLCACAWEVDGQWGTRARSQRMPTLCLMAPNLNPRPPPNSESLFLGPALTALRTPFREPGQTALSRDGVLQDRRTLGR